MPANSPAPRQPEPTASETYTQRAGDIARLMHVIEMELEKHAAAATAEPKSWGHAGDLGKVRSDLMNIVCFLSGMTTEQVEYFLAE